MTKICATSDLHGWLPDVPECDILIVAGDICGPSDIFSQMKEMYNNFIPWLNSVKARKKIIVAGNHDIIFQDATHMLPKWPDDVIYLQDNGCVIDGLTFYGSPWQIEFCNWAFNLTEEQLVNRWALIPDKVDVLITHSPPYGYGDADFNGNNLGSPSLTNKVLQIQPKLHCWGHIHEGFSDRPYLIKNTLGYNVAHVNHAYKPTNKPVMIEL